ncbi:MAG: type III secretion system export apparatus subunit SctS [Pseudolabrys sp.]
MVTADSGACEDLCALTGKGSASRRQAKTNIKGTSMSPNDAINALTEAMTLVMVLSLPPILVASVVGIVVSLLQALTQVQEQTIAFAVKLIAVAVMMAAMASLAGNQLLTYTLGIFNNFPRMT